MGNCQASDAVSTLLEYPNGRVERLYWTISARQVMLQNPGYYVGVYLWPKPSSSPKQKPRMKILPPSAILVTGHYYRLVSFEGKIIPLLLFKLSSQYHLSPLAEVLENFSSRNVGGRRLNSTVDAAFLTAPDTLTQMLSDKKADVAMAAKGMSARQWRPSLQSISESM